LFYAAGIRLSGETVFVKVVVVDFCSGGWMRNAYMSLAMSLAISLVTLWLKGGLNGQAVSQEVSYVS
jgi:hypothetical protein